PTGPVAPRCRPPRLSSPRLLLSGRGRDAGDGPGVLAQQVGDRCDHDPPVPSYLDVHPVARLEPGLLQHLGGQAQSASLLDVEVHLVPVGPRLVSGHRAPAHVTAARRIAAHPGTVTTRCAPRPRPRMCGGTCTPRTRGRHTWD